MASRAVTLRRKAYLLSGDWHSADDLVQETLISVYAGWARIARGRNVDAYANRVLVHKFIDDRRRPWRRERLVAIVPETVDRGAARALADVDGQDHILTAALACLPAEQRAVVVLRFTDDLTIEEIATVMGLPSGTVKSRLSRASEMVRRDLARRGHPAAPAALTLQPASTMED
jgi:RNA polymerase sigma-70 factor (sigma-E family)